MSVQDLTSELSHRMRNRRVEEFLPTWLIPEAEENAWFHIYIYGIKIRIVVNLILLSWARTPSYSVSSAACFQCCCAFSVETSPSTPPFFRIFFSHQGTTAMAAPKLGALIGLSKDRACHSSNPQCQAGHLLRVELPETSTAHHRRRSELSSRCRSKPCSTSVRPLSELTAVLSLRAVLHVPRGPNRSYNSTATMCLWKCSNGTTPQCPPLGPIQAMTLLPARCSLKCLNHGQNHIFNSEPLILP
jgi:hypothetical protein